MGERIAVKPGSNFERTSSQKRQLALQTEKSTVGISMFHDLAAPPDSSSVQAADTQPSNSSNSSLSQLGESLHSDGSTSSHEELDRAGGQRGAASQQGSASEEQLDSGGLVSAAREDQQSCSDVCGELHSAGSAVLGGSAESSSTCGHRASSGPGGACFVIPSQYSVCVCWCALRGLAGLVYLALVPAI